MTISSLPRTIRSLPLLFSLLFYPLLYFVDRQMGIALATSSRPAMAIYLEAVASAILAALASLLVAFLLSLALERSPLSTSERLRFFLRPSNGTIAVFSAISITFWAVVIARPTWALSPGLSVEFDLIFAWPLAVLYLGMIVLGNAVTGEPPLLVQFAVVGVGITLSAVWLFLLSGGIASVLRRVTS